MGRFTDKLRALAGEADEAARIEQAGTIDAELENLDERWENREAAEKAEAERDKAIAERDEWRKRYADRFFDGGSDPKPQTPPDPSDPGEGNERPKGYAALWDGFYR